MLRTASNAGELAVGQDLEVQMTRGVDDPAWDHFVEHAPGGHYTQSVAWARFRAAFGWDTARVVVREGGQLVAGSQVLLRRVTGLGAVGYVQHGPVVASRRWDVVDLALRSLLTLCRSERIQYVMVRPPTGEDFPHERLRQLGFQRTHRLTKPARTARVDLAPEPDELLARMRRSTRGNVRRGLARGLVVRQGTGEDLAIVLRLERLLAERKGFKPASSARYRTLWRALEVDDRGVIFVVEDEHGTPVAGQFSIRHGDTLYSHIMAWSGEQASRKPNELLDWTAMSWARQAGCRYYDFEGIAAPPASDDRPADGRADAADQMWVPDYKLGFGAEVVPASLDYDLVVAPVLRWAYTRVLPRVEQRPSVQRLDRRLQRVLAGRADQA
ncbi:lipid II:glycine glycyltransferase FemX [Egicoccus sp. AB-alg2]|uniref:lipid II:glycine glycyltransferase FemX n=1 Tax=Egicoccus sp. AB-alg2 TaxID=3242693 RepID=UPI00359D24F7